MGIILSIVLAGVAFVTYLIGYCAGSCDKQKELANKFSLTK